MFKTLFRPCGACSLFCLNPRLAPWAAFFRRCAADLWRWVGTTEVVPFPEAAGSAGRAGTTGLACLFRISGPRFFADALADGKRHLAGFFVGVNDHMIAVQNFAVEDFERERILNQFLNGTFQRTCSEVGIVAFGEQQF